jgi:hypothetical protein
VLSLFSFRLAREGNRSIVTREIHFSSFPFLFFLQNGLPTRINLFFFFQRCRDARTDAVRLTEAAAAAVTQQQEEQQQQQLSKRPTATTSTSMTPKPMLAAKS